MFKKAIALTLCIVVMTSFCFAKAGSKIEEGGTGQDVSGTDMASHAYTNSVQPNEGWVPWDFNAFVGKTQNVKGREVKEMKFLTGNRLHIDGKWEVEYWDAGTYIEYQYVEDSLYGDNFDVFSTYLVDYDGDGVLKEPTSGLVDKSAYPETYTITEYNAKSKSKDYASNLKQGKITMRDDISFKYKDTGKVYKITDPDVYIALQIIYRANEDQEPKGNIMEWMLSENQIRLIKLGQPPAGLALALEESEVSDTVTT